MKTLKDLNEQNPTLYQAKKLLAKFDKQKIINFVYDSDEFQNGFDWHFGEQTTKEIMKMIEAHIKTLFNN